MSGQGPLGLMSLAEAQSRQATFSVVVKRAWDGASGDIGGGGDVVVTEAMALEPEDLPLALDAGVGVMEPIVGQGSTVFSSEVNRLHDSSSR
jgi:hypothetical protein